MTPSRTERASVGFLSFIVGVTCASACNRDADLTAALTRLASIRSPAEAHRTFADLDVTGDAIIDARDWTLFDRVATIAAQRLRDRGRDVTLASEFYAGPTGSEPPAFSLLGISGGSVDATGVPENRLAEVLIESRWLAMQSRLAAQAGKRPPDTKVGGMLVTSLPGYDADVMEPAAVCNALHALNLDAYKRANLQPTAVFDLDSTLWAGNGTDVLLASVVALGLPLEEANPTLRAFLKSLPDVDPNRIDKAPIGENAKLFLERVLDTSRPVAQRVSDKDAFYNIIALFKGLAITKVREAARFAIEHGAFDLPPWKARVFGDRDGCGTLDLINRLKERGVDVYILSATPDVMVEEAAQLFGITADHVVGSALEVKDGRFTGNVRESTYGIKATVTRQWLTSPPLVGFGDSPRSDFSMLLETTVAGFMVNPRPDFLKRDESEAGGRLVSVSFDGTLGDLIKQQAQTP